MSSQEIQRIALQLETIGYSHTSFDQLDIPFDAEQAAELSMKVEASSESAEALSVVEHIKRDGMTIVQDELCMNVAKTIMAPVIEAVYMGNSAAIDTWTIFGLNRYTTGGSFGTHRDSVDTTIFLTTIKGSREFEIYVTGDSEPGSTDFSEVEARFLLEPGSIMILDGEKDPAHAVSRAIVSSVVVVADVPLPHLCRANRL